MQGHVWYGGGKKVVVHRVERYHDSWTRSEITLNDFAIAGTLPGTTHAGGYSTLPYILELLYSFYIVPCTYGEVGIYAQGQMKLNNKGK